MATEVMFIKVRIYRRTMTLDPRRLKGQADFPPFAELPESDDFDWGNAWIGHDQKESLGTGRDYGQWLMAATPEFATAARARWPHLIEILSETDAAAFYADRCSCHDAEILVDHDVVASIDAMVRLEAAGVKAVPTAAEQAFRTAALDPSTEARGIRTNTKKTLAGLLTDRGTTAKRDVATTPLASPPAGWRPGEGR